MARPCPRCEYELDSTIASGLHRCPECGWAFTDRDLFLLFETPDPGGAPRSLNPHERRIRGWIVVLVILPLMFMGLLILPGLLGVPFWGAVIAPRR